MAEEQRLQEKHSSCANNCGFFGSSATLNLCSKCFRDHQLKESLATSATPALPDNPLKPASSTVESEAYADVTVLPGLTAKQEVESVEKATALGNRCFVCRKRVGMTGFKCRCGPTFCGVHRYPEHHTCEFDFKGVAREAIAHANPVIKADKLGRKI